MSLTPRNEGQSEKSDAFALVQAKDFGVLPIPRRLRHSAEDGHPPFSLLLNATFGFACCCIVANLYYCQPLLIQISASFGVSYSEVSRVPTLLQAGYASGVLLISPLGDLVRRRPLILLLIFICSTLSLSLAVTKSFLAFQILSFLVGFTTVTPQVLIPLAADIAPSKRRASAISIVLCGSFLGNLLGRLIAGIVAEFASWRIIYYVAAGEQYFVLFVLYWMIPDYPAKSNGLSYFGILWSMAKLIVTEPMLVQACLIIFASNACYVSYWVTLTFILGNSPYHYSTLVIGLFSLIGLLGVSLTPLIGHFIDRLHAWHAVLLSTLGLTVFWAIETGAAGLNVAAVVITCLGLDIFDLMQQTSLAATALSISEGSTARMNALLILSNYIGQVMGTSVSTRVYVEHGWQAASAVSLGWMGFQVLVLLARGPHCGRYVWIGYEGGIGWRKQGVDLEEKGGGDVECDETTETKEKETACV